MQKTTNDQLIRIRESVARIQRETLARGIPIHYYIGDRLVEHRPDGTIVDVKLPVPMNSTYDTPMDGVVAPKVEEAVS